MLPHSSAARFASQYLRDHEGLIPDSTIRINTDSAHGAMYVRGASEKFTLSCPPTSHHTSQKEEQQVTGYGKMLKVRKWGNVLKPDTFMSANLKKWIFWEMDVQLADSGGSRNHQFYTVFEFEFKLLNCVHASTFGPLNSRTSNNT